MRFHLARFNILAALAAFAILCGHAGISFAASAEEQRGEIRNAVVIFDEGGEARVAGPVSLDSTGLLDGDITVTFKDGDKLGQALARAIPEAASVIKPALSAAALAAGKDKEASLILTIRKGRVSAGFIPIGNIPAL